MSTEHTSAQRPTGARARPWIPAVLATIGLGLLVWAQDGAPPSKPRHRGLPPGTDCAACHITANWHKLRPRPKVRFRHKLTGFPLRAAHASLQCNRCHDGRGIAREAAGCVVCHADVHKGENGQHCERCHNERSFTVTAAVREHRKTRMPLVGAHALLECTACHGKNKTGRFRGAPTACFACHAKQYAATQNPPHAASGFSTRCEQCHTPRAWSTRVSGFHKSFPLRGAHARLACDACHAGGRYRGTPRDCFACHAQDYNAATNPPHASSGFPTRCDQCHTDTAWVPASRFKHTIWPLTGAHRGLDCNRCHGGGVFRGTPRDCFSCHSADYNATTNPNHAASGFGTQCDACHSTSAWRPANFDHDRFFPITSGKHSRFRNDCNICHPSPNDKSQFTCLSCHEHSRSRMDSKHRGRRGYSYDSNACYRCHPRGKE
ncbi:MAG: hypothetical protein D6776_06370 [Planctomycetota bacterium]|nr:MAG: hypothetical protein D6776_06370 [Planctomycetota bacterium]